MSERGEATTKIVGPQERFDQKYQMHSYAAIGGVGEKVQKRWTAESKDPFRRIFYPENRSMNVPIRSWRSVADGPLNPERTEVKDPAHMAGYIKEVARFLGADLVGVCELNQAYVYSRHGLRIDYAKGLGGKEIELPHKYAISVAVEMNYDRLRYEPGRIGNAEVGLGYLNVGKVAVALAAFIRELGWPARAHFFINEWVMHVPLAEAAGLGELARNSILVTPEFGPRHRLATITTDLPLAIDSPIDIGVVKTCNVCKKCAVNCPSQAIPHGEKQEINGVLKWDVNQERCIRMWVANPDRWNDCARCISVCPWNQKNTWYHKAAVGVVKRSAMARHLLLWMDNLIRGKEPRPEVRWLDYVEGGRTARIVKDKEIFDEPDNS